MSFVNRFTQECKRPMIDAGTTVSMILVTQ